MNSPGNLLHLDNVGVSAVEEATPMEVQNEATTTTNFFESWVNCIRCPLHANRKRTVFGTGNMVDPKIFIVGQSPGETEDETGIPFSGKVSKEHLNPCMKHVGIDREQDCYLTNSVICRPWIPNVKNNMPPTVNSLLECRPRLKEEFRRVMPSVKVIVLVGKEAYMTWLMSDAMQQPGFDSNSIRVKPLLGWIDTSHMTNYPRIYFVYHPSYISRRGDYNLASEWMSDWQAISDYVKTGQVVEPRKS